MRCEHQIMEHTRVYSFRQCHRKAKYAVTFKNGMNTNMCGICLGTLKRLAKETIQSIEPLANED